MTAAGQDPVAQALQRVLAAHHAAVYGYPVIGVRLTDGGQLQRARQLEASHRQSRDDLMGQLAARRLSPVPAEPSYAPAEPVTGPTGAQRWALQLEQNCASAYRYLLTVTAPGPTGSHAAAPNQAPDELTAVRRQALTGLSIAAQNGTGWRTLLTPAAPTEAFPGL